MAPEGLSGRAQRASPSSCGARGGRSLAWLGSLQELTAAVTNFRARCPSLRRACRLWAQAFLAPAPPPRLPAPRRGWSCSAGPLNPGRTGGRLLGEGGASRSAAARSAPSTAKGRGRRATPGAVGWGPGQLPEATRTHTLTHIQRHTRAHALTPRPLLCGPGPVAPTPRRRGEIKGSRKGCYLSSQGLRESDISHCSPNDTLPFLAQGLPAKALGVLYTRDSGYWLVSLPLPGALSQWVWALPWEQSQPSRVSGPVGPGLTVGPCTEGWLR